MRWQVFLGGAGALLGLWSASVLAQPVCSFKNLQVVAASQLDATAVCEGASRALWFLDEHGLSLKEPVVLHVSPVLPKKHPKTAAGVYLSESRQIHMLSFSAFQKFENWFKTPINRETYIGLATHEVAHAITDSHFKVDKPSVHAREYLAYVTLFATVPTRQREQMLLALPGQTPEDEARLSLMVYLMDPMFFGAQAYRHFMSLSHPAQIAFLDAVLSGKVFAD